MSADKCVLLCSGSADPSLWHRVHAMPSPLQGEGGGAAPQLLLEEEESGLSIRALISATPILWDGLSSCEHSRAAEQDSLGHLPRAQGWLLHQPLPPPLCWRTYTMLSKQLCV